MLDMNGHRTRNLTERGLLRTQWLLWGFIVAMAACSAAMRSSVSPAAMARAASAVSACACTAAHSSRQAIRREKRETNMTEIV